jgi:hypothetical protein
MDWKQAEWASKTHWHSGLAKVLAGEPANALAEWIGRKHSGLAKSTVD